MEHQIKNYNKEIASAFYSYALDDFLSDRENKDRMKLIFHRYFVDGFDLSTIAQEVNLTRERVRQIVEKTIKIIKSRINTQCEILEFTKKESKKARVLEFEVIKLKKIEDSLFEVELNKIEYGLIEIEELDLSPRSYNILKAAHIRTIKDLSDYSRADILKFRNCGKNTLYELEEILEKKGYKFKDS